MEPIRRGIEHFLRGRYGYEGYRAFRVLAVPVLIGAILVVGWLLIGPLLTIPRFTTEGPVVRNGVAVIVLCGKKQRDRDAEDEGTVRGEGLRTRAKDRRVAACGEGQLHGLVSPAAGCRAACCTTPACG